MCSRQFLLLAAFVLALAAPRSLTAQTSRWLPPTDSLAQMITVRETEWAQNVCTPNSVQEKLLATDFVGTSTNGQRYSKAKAIADDKTSKDDIRDCQLMSARVHLFGSALATVYGSESSVRTDASGKAAKRCQVWTDIWLRRDGVWQVIAAQDAVIPCDAKTSLPAS